VKLDEEASDSGSVGCRGTPGSLHSN
jgi:hypothetical protein